MLKYNIHNHKKLLGEIAAEGFEEAIEKSIRQLEKLFKRYSKPVTVEVILTEDGRQYVITLEINLKTGPVVVKRSGFELYPLLKEAVATLRKQIISRLSKERKEHLYKRKERQVATLGDLVQHLDETYETDDKVTFEHLFKSGIPGLYNYFARRLRQTRLKDQKDDSLSIDNLINELYLRVYDQFGDHPKDQQELLGWIYQIADDILEEKLKEQGTDEPAADSEELRKQEYEELQQTFSVDAERQPTMLDEFDDPAFIHNLYNVEDIFTDNPDEAGRIQQQVDEVMSRNEFHDHILEELSRQSLFHRSVFDLYVLEKFDMEEIAEIKNSTVDEINEVILNTRTYLKEKVRSWLKVEA